MEVILNAHIILLYLIVGWMAKWLWDKFLLAKKETIAFNVALDDGLPKWQKDVEQAIWDKVFKAQEATLKAQNETLDVKMKIYAEIREALEWPESKVHNFDDYIREIRMLKTMNKLKSGVPVLDGQIPEKNTNPFFQKVCATIGFSDTSTCDEVIGYIANGAANLEWHRNAMAKSRKEIREALGWPENANDTWELTVAEIKTLKTMAESKPQLDCADSVAIHKTAIDLCIAIIDDVATVKDAYWKLVNLRNATDGKK